MVNGLPFPITSWKLKQPEWPWGSSSIVMSIWYMEVFEGMTADCRLFWAKAFPQISCPQLKKAGETLMFDVARCDWLKCDKTIYPQAPHLKPGEEHKEMWNLGLLLNSQWSVWWISTSGPFDEIKPKCLSSCQDWLFAPQVRQCKNQSRVCYIFMNRNYKLLRLKTNRFKKAIKGGLYQ